MQQASHIALFSSVVCLLDKHIGHFAQSEITTLGLLATGIHWNEGGVGLAEGIAIGVIFHWGLKKLGISDPRFPGGSGE